MSPDLLNSIEAQIKEIEYQIDLTKGVIVGTPWIIECCTGLYLVADGDRYRGGSITGRTVCYSPDRIDAAVQYIRENGFEDARKVDRRDALRTELGAMREIRARLQKLMSLEAGDAF